MSVRTGCDAFALPAEMHHDTLASFALPLLQCEAGAATTKASDFILSMLTEDAREEKSAFSPSRSIRVPSARRPNPHTNAKFHRPKPKDDVGPELQSWVAQSVSLLRQQSMAAEWEFRGAPNIEVLVARCQELSDALQRTAEGHQSARPFLQVIGTTMKRAAQDGCASLEDQRLDFCRDEFERRASTIRQPFLEEIAQLRQQCDEHIAGIADIDAWQHELADALNLHHDELLKQVTAARAQHQKEQNELDMLQQHAIGLLTKQSAATVETGQLQAVLDQIAAISEVNLALTGAKTALIDARAFRKKQYDDEVEQLMRTRAMADRNERMLSAKAGAVSRMIADHKVELEAVEAELLRVSDENSEVYAALQTAEAQFRLREIESLRDWTPRPDMGDFDDEVDNRRAKTKLKQKSTVSSADYLVKRLAALTGSTKKLAEELQRLRRGLRPVMDGVLSQSAPAGSDGFASNDHSLLPPFGGNQFQWLFTGAEGDHYTTDAHRSDNDDDGEEPSPFTGEEISLGGKRKTRPTRAWGVPPVETARLALWTCESQALTLLRELKKHADVPWIFSPTSDLWPKSRLDEPKLPAAELLRRTSWQNEWQEAGLVSYSLHGMVHGRIGEVLRRASVSAFGEHAVTVTSSVILACRRFAKESSICEALCLIVGGALPISFIDTVDRTLVRMVISALLHASGENKSGFGAVSLSPEGAPASVAAMANAAVGVGMSSASPSNNIVLPVRSVMAGLNREYSAQFGNFETMQARFALLQDTSVGSTPTNVKVHLLAETGDPDRRTGLFYRVLLKHAIQQRVALVSQLCGQLAAAETAPWTVRSCESLKSRADRFRIDLNNPFDAGSQPFVRGARFGAPKLVGTTAGTLVDEAIGVWSDALQSATAGYCSDAAAQLSSQTDVKGSTTRGKPGQKSRSKEPSHLTVDPPVGALLFLIPSMASRLGPIVQAP